MPRSEKHSPEGGHVQCHHPWLESALALGRWARADALEAGSACPAGLTTVPPPGPEGGRGSESWQQWLVLPTAPDLPGKGTVW